MLFTPNYTVSYKGVFHKAGKSFPIDPADADEMAQHGTVEVPTKPVQAPQETPDKLARKGRPRKAGSE